MASGLRSFDPLEILPEDLRERLAARLSSQNLTFLPPGGTTDARPASGPATAGTAAARRLLERGSNPPLDPRVELRLLEQANIPDVATGTETSDLAPRLGAKSVLPTRSDLVEALGWAEEWLGGPDPARRERGEHFDALRDLLLLVWAPALSTRLGLALLGCLDRGWLSPGGRWSIVVADRLAATPLLLPSLLEVFAAVGALFGERIAPDECRLEIEDGDAFLLYARPSGGYEISETAPGSERAAVRLALQPEWVLASERLPPTKLPQVLISRGAVGGTEIDRSPGHETTDEDPGESGAGTLAHRSAGTDRALARLLNFVFAKSKVRSGQLETIYEIFSGRDCTACLPRARGRVAYQLASVLRPGYTLVVAPTEALIENRMSALRRAGIDRLARLAEPAERVDSSNMASPTADALFVFARASELRHASLRRDLAHLFETRRPSLVAIEEAQSLSELSPACDPAYAGLPHMLRAATASRGPATPLLALVPPSDRTVLRDLTGLMSPPESPGTLVDAPAPAAARLNVIRASPSKAMTRLENLLHTMPKRFGLPAARFFSVEAPDTARGVILCSRLDGPFGIVAVGELVRHQGLCHEIGLYSEACPRGLDPESFSESCRRDLAAFARGDLPLLITTCELGAGTEFPALRYAVFFGVPAAVDPIVRMGQTMGHRTSRPDAAGLTEVDLVQIAKSEQRVAALLAKTSNASTGAADVRSRLAISTGVLGEPDDLPRALAAHVASFPDPGRELARLAGLLETLEAGRVKDRALLEIGGIANGRMKRGAKSAGSTEETASNLAPTERSLARLVMIGAVRDWSIEDDATIAVTMPDPPLPALERGVLELALRIDPPSAIGVATRIAQSSPLEARKRSRALLAEALDLTERCIEPERRRAIAKIWTLTSKAGPAELPEPAAPVRGTIGGKLETFSTAKRTAPAKWLALFDDVLVQEGPDLREAAASLGPNRPESCGVSFAAVLGELYTRGDRSLFSTRLAEALSAAAEHGAPAPTPSASDAPVSSKQDWPAARELFDWIMPRVQTYRPSWSSAAWSAWREAGGPHHLLGNTEIVSLAGPSQSVDELSILLARRLTEACDILASLKEHYTMDAAEL